MAPNALPINAVTAMAKEPQKVTLRAARPRGAPPARAPTAPRIAKKNSDMIATTRARSHPIRWVMSRNKQGGEFFRNCGNVVGHFDVANTATVYWSDSDGDYELPSGVATVTIKEGIVLDKFQNKAKHAAVELTNFRTDDKVIDFVEFAWPDKNAEVRQVTLGGVVIWTGAIEGDLVGGIRHASFGLDPWP